MKPSVLLIDAHPKAEPDKLQPYIDWLASHFAIETVRIENFRPAAVAADAVVVTGSEWQINRDPVPAPVVELYQKAATPLLGICWGHQTLAYAWGAAVIKKPFIETIEVIRIEKPDRLLARMEKSFYAFESHYEHVVRNDDLLKNFEVLASSGSCKVEAIRHKKRPLWGVQFHLERSGEICKPIAANFAEIVKKFNG